MIGGSAQLTCRPGTFLREPADDMRGLDLVMAAYDGLEGLRA